METLTTTILSPVKHNDLQPIKKRTKTMINTHQKYYANGINCIEISILRLKKL
jgi:hypothetical protein